ncbi:DUF454 family protein [Halomonas denitrificans]|nr:YbaN family protein [Halomonas denitrificans]
MQRVHRALALVCLTTGGIGLVLPLLPTTPFLLLAAWSASRGAPELAERIRRHPQFGPAVRDWEDQRAVPRSAKCLALTLLSASALVLVVTDLPQAARAIVLPLLAAIAAWIASRPAPRRGAQ